MPKLLILLALFTACSGPSTQTNGPGADGTAELRKLTQGRFDANTANDRSFYERLLASNFVVLTPAASPMTKKEYLDNEFLPQSVGHRGEGASITEFRALVDGNTAVVSYWVVEPTPLGQQRFEARWKHVDTYVRINGEWRLLSMALAAPPSWPEVAAIDPHFYSDYVGTYQLSPDVHVRITYEGGHLMLEQTGLAKEELFPENATTFFAKTDDATARTVFERDGSGKVVAQIYRSMGQQVRATKMK
jgi:hypothetical protein